MNRGMESYQVGGQELLLAHGKRLSGDSRVEQEVMKPRLALEDTRIKGTLIPIGGAATNDNLRVVVDHIPLGDALTIITTTTAIPDEQFGNYSERFASVNLSQEPFHLGEHTIPQEGDAMLRLSGGVFATGGDQIRGRDLMLRSGHAKGLHDFYNTGKVVAGTSAGAHMLGEITSYGDGIKEGIGLTDLAVFDTHTNTRNRVERQRDIVEFADVINFALPEGGGVVYEADGNVSAFGKDIDLRWRYNGVQRTAMLPKGQDIALWSLPRKYSFKQFA